MAEDKEKRFHRIMDKLYRYPKPRLPPRSVGGGTSTQQKERRRGLGSREEPENSIRHAAAGIGAQEGGTPPCRPWDRGDLMRRLATFKAMTWFGKPKAIDPVNCARRGWVNVEMDTLSCEACGARLLFSTPSSWTLQQVEKAAAVFSLKLDSGHKLLCPWIDNICDEALAFFPPTAPPSLIEGYKERSAALLQLSALPVISSSAIDYMRSPQLEDFFAKSSILTYKLDGGMKLTVSSGSVILDSASAVDASSQYYQVLKIISLCGWEPRVLPYVVDCEDHSSLSMKKDKAVDSSSETLRNKNPGVVIYSSTLSGESDGERRDQPSLGDYDPASVVLDCKLCGACAGLWAFGTILRPLELFNLTESPEEDGQSGPAPGSADSASNVNSLSLNLTIAGGPPPTKQNFKPRISLPIVTRHLRFAFGSNGEIRNHASADAQGVGQLNAQSLEFQEGNKSSNLLFSSESSGMLKRKRSENEYSTYGGSSCDVQPCLNGIVNVGADSLNNEQKTGHLSFISQSEEGLMHEDRCGKTSVEANKCLQNAMKDLVRSTMVTDDAENGRSAGEVWQDINLQPGDSTCITTDSILFNDDGVCENRSIIGTAGIYNQDNDGYSGMDVPSHVITSEVNYNSKIIACDAIPESHIISDAERNKNLIDKDGGHREGGDEMNTMQSHMDGSAGIQNVPRLEDRALNSVDVEVAVVRTSSKSDGGHGEGGDEMHTMQLHMDRSADIHNVPRLEDRTLHEDRCGKISVEANKCLQNASKDLVRSTMVTDDAENGRSAGEVGQDLNLQTGDSTCITTHSILLNDDGACENRSIISTAGIYSQDKDGYSGMDGPSHGITSEVNYNSKNIACDAIPESHIISDAERNENLIGKDGGHGEGGDEMNTMQSHMDGSTDIQNVPRLEDRTLNSVDAEVAVVCTSSKSDGGHGEGGDEMRTMQSHMDGSADIQNVPRLEDRTLNSVDAEVAIVRTWGNSPSSSSQWDNTDKFDPIRQHRPFCPWIAQMHDENMPGWKVTLRALVQDKCPPRAEAPSSFSDEVDDPIVSVRKLFTTPPSKRLRRAS